MNSTVRLMHIMPTITIAMLFQSLPNQIRAPRPRLAATISALSTVVQASARQTFRPLMMPGSAPGRTTSRMTAASEAPRLRAALISSGSTRRVLSITYSRAEAKVPMKTMAYFCSSPMPNQRIESGIQESDGSGRMMEMTGSESALARREVPMMTPSGTAARLARAKPISTRRVLVRACSSSGEWRCASMTRTDRRSMDRSSGRLRTCDSTGRQAAITAAIQRGSSIDGP